MQHVNDFFYSITYISVTVFDIESFLNTFWLHEAKHFSSPSEAEGNYIQNR